MADEPAEKAEENGDELALTEPVSIMARVEPWLPWIGAGTGALVVVAMMVLTITATVRSGSMQNELSSVRAQLDTLQLLTQEASENTDARSLATGVRETEKIRNQYETGLTDLRTVENRINERAEQFEKRQAGRLERVYPDLLYHYSEGDIPDKTVEYGLLLVQI